MKKKIYFQQVSIYSLSTGQLGQLFATGFVDDDVDDETIVYSRYSFPVHAFNKIERLCTLRRRLKTNPPKRNGY